MRRRANINQLKLFTLLICFVPLLLGTAAKGFDVSAAASKTWVYDDAGLLQDEQIKTLSDKIEKVREDKKLDIVIVTTRTTGGETPADFADDFYDLGGFGYDKPRGTGILLLIDMGQRNLWISTCGAAQKYFTDKRLDMMLDEIYDDLSDGNYYEGCKTFISQTDKYMNLNPNLNPLTLKGTLIRFVIAAALGCFITFIFVARRGGRNTTNAYTYSAGGKCRLNQSYEHFSHKLVTTRHIEHHSGGSGGGGGSGSSHTSSSGVSHGGRGRSF